ncbi:hypothetical protein C8R43DRAFT_1183920 [Mycena crocata]|nr:hypothetical protein C8R43DRAFT_1183920 [Mycena crocata]
MPLVVRRRAPPTMRTPNITPGACDEPCTCRTKERRAPPMFKYSARSSGVRLFRSRLPQLVTEFFVRFLCNSNTLRQCITGVSLFHSLQRQALHPYLGRNDALPEHGSLAPLNAVTSELSVECLISALITFISQMYFVYVLHIVKNRAKAAFILKALIIMLGTISLAGGVGCVTIMFIHPHFMHRNRTFIILAGINKAFGAAADIVATVAMCIFLNAADTGITKTSSLLRSLMHLVINRGILVTFGQVLMLLLFFTSTTRLYWVAVHINTTKLYVNTFFAMLNSRATGVESREVHSMVLSRTFDTSRIHSSSFETKTPSRAINITTSSTVADI